MELLVLSSFPAHASGNVGDRLLLESTMELVETVHGSTTFDVHWRGEDFTSRLASVNEMDGILLCGFEYTKLRSGQYQIAEDLDAVEPPLIPIGAMHRFFPGDRTERLRQDLEPAIRAFLDRVARHCPDNSIPVRTDWVGEILGRHGYRTTLTGDPGWYDPAYIGEPFHAPDSIDDIVFTTPHSELYLDQAKDLLAGLSEAFTAADRTLVLHAAPTALDRTLTRFAKANGWDVRFASHETNFLEPYRESDLHVGYRKHGHLAHLRWRRPSVVIAEDSRAMGLTELFGTAGFRGFVPREGIRRRVGSLYDSLPVVGLWALLDGYGFAEALPHRESFVAKPAETVTSDVLEFVNHQLRVDWRAFEDVRSVIDQTYREGMRPFLRDALDPLD